MSETRRFAVIRVTRIRPLHAEPRAFDSLDRVSAPDDLDLRGTTAAEEVQQKLTRQPHKTGGGIAAPDPNHLSGSDPLDLESGAAKSSGEEPRHEPDISPQRRLHLTRVRTRVKTVGSAHVFVVNKEFVEVGKSPHPGEAEEAGGWPRPDRRYQLGVVAARERFSSPLGEAAPSTGDDEPGCRDGVMLAKHQMGHQIAGGPRREESRRIGAEFIKQGG